MPARTMDAWRRRCDAARVIECAMRDSVYDLTALSERLFAEGRLRPLAGKIQRAQDLSSLHADLVMATECLDALDALLATPPQDDNLTKSITEASLLSNAVVLYARATKTTSDERRGYDPRDKFSPEQKIVHQELCDLRDKAIAHFGSGGSYTGEWKLERVVLDASVAEDVRVGVATRRKTVDKKLAARARSQIEFACELFRQLSRRQIDELTDELNKLAAADAELVNSEIHRHPLNLPMVLTSSDALVRIRALPIEISVMRFESRLIAADQKAIPSHGGSVRGLRRSRAARLAAAVAIRSDTQLRPSQHRG